jgi:hypothetical protein
MKRLAYDGLNLLPMAQPLICKKNLSLNEKELCVRIMFDRSMRNLVLGICGVGRCERK